jgi:hypothetical protein
MARAQNEKTATATHAADHPIIDGHPKTDRTEPELRVVSSVSGRFGCSRFNSDSSGRLI